MKLDKITKDRINDYFNNISAEELLEKSKEFIVLPTDEDIENESLLHDVEYMSEHFFIKGAKWLKENVIVKEPSIITLESLKYDLLTNHEIFININKMLFNKKFKIEIIYYNILANELVQLSQVYFIENNVEIYYDSYYSALDNSIKFVKKLIENKDLHLKNNNEKFPE